MKAAVDQWEIQNEVDLPQYYDRSRDWAYYVNNDLRGAWDVLHPVGEKVISGAVFSLAGARGLHAAGVEQYCDTVGYHLYVADPAAMVDRTAQLKEIFGAEPITLTEWNFRAASESAWARYLRDAHAFIASNFESAYYFRFSVNDAYTGRAGLVNADYTPHGAFYDAFKSWSAG